ncbi:hypothetical protein AQUCO_00400436v1 [Aquilegia coerulea]|uniref:Uncharacterized protein n=1 Tax=Aquilegia coerulea TaxID=218851 RepID=A0A2G5EV49_AQUCA|nr:hypothetical protein AQUCO_00400436v1 [Aquilegia coerulea]
MSSNQQISLTLFRSQLQLRRFDEGTLGILDSILVSKDVKSLLQLRNGLKRLLRSESVSYLQEISHKSIHDKLLILDFFVRAFALVADVESCLALRYEALLLRDRISVNHTWLRVSYEEWLTFARDSLDNGFYSIAIKGCENALLCFQANNDVKSKSNIYLTDSQVIDEIRKVKDVAVKLIAPHSGM